MANVKIGDRIMFASEHVSPHGKKADLCDPATVIGFTDKKSPIVAWKKGEKACYLNPKNSNNRFQQDVEACPTHMDYEYFAYANISFDVVSSVEEAKVPANKIPEVTKKPTCQVGDRVKFERYYQAHDPATIIGFVDGSPLVAWKKDENALFRNTKNHSAFFQKSVESFPGHENYTYFGFATVSELAVQADEPKKPILLKDRKIGERFILIQDGHEVEVMLIAYSVPGRPNDYESNGPILGFFNSDDRIYESFYGPLHPLTLEERHSTDIVNFLKIDADQSLVKQCVGFRTDNARRGWKNLETKDVAPSVKAKEQHKNETLNNIAPGTHIRMYLTDKLGFSTKATDKRTPEGIMLGYHSSGNQIIVWLNESNEGTAHALSFGGFADHALADDKTKEAYAQIKDKIKYYHITSPDRMAEVIKSSTEETKVEEKKALVLKNIKDIKPGSKIRIPVNADSSGLQRNNTGYWSHEATYLGIKDDLPMVFWEHKSGEKTGFALEIGRCSSRMQTLLSPEQQKTAKWIHYTTLIDNVELVSEPTETFTEEKKSVTTLHENVQIGSKIKVYLTKGRGTYCSYEKTNKLSRECTVIGKTKGGYLIIVWDGDSNQGTGEAVAFADAKTFINEEDRVKFITPEIQATAKWFHLIKFNECEVISSPIEEKKVEVKKVKSLTERALGEKFLMDFDGKDVEVCVVAKDPVVLGFKSKDKVSGMDPVSFTGLLSKVQKSISDAGQADNAKNYAGFLANVQNRNFQNRKMKDLDAAPTTLTETVKLLSKREVGDCFQIHCIDGVYREAVLLDKKDLIIGYRSQHGVDKSCFTIDQLKIINDLAPEAKAELKGYHSWNGDSLRSTKESKLPKLEIVAKTNPVYLSSRQVGDYFKMMCPDGVYREVVLLDKNSHLVGYRESYGNPQSSMLTQYRNIIDRINHTAHSQLKGYHTNMTPSSTTTLESGLPKLDITTDVTPLYSRKVGDCFQMRGDDGIYREVVLLNSASGSVGYRVSGRGETYASSDKDRLPQLTATDQTNIMGYHMTISPSRETKPSLVGALVLECLQSQELEKRNVGDCFRILGSDGHYHEVVLLNKEEFIVGYRSSARGESFDYMAGAGGKQARLSHLTETDKAHFTSYHSYLGDPRRETIPSEIKRVHITKIPPDKKLSERKIGESFKIVVGSSIQEVVLLGIDGANYIIGYRGSGFGSSWESFNCKELLISWGKENLASIKGYMRCTDNLLTKDSQNPTMTKPAIRNANTVKVGEHFRLNYPGVGWLEAVCLAYDAANNRNILGIRTSNSVCNFAALYTEHLKHLSEEQKANFRGYLPYSLAPLAGQWIIEESILNPVDLATKPIDETLQKLIIQEEINKAQLASQETIKKLVVEEVSKQQEIYDKKEAILKAEVDSLKNTSKDLRSLIDQDFLSVNTLISEVKTEAKKDKVEIAAIAASTATVVTLVEKAASSLLEKQGTQSKVDDKSTGSNNNGSTITKEKGGKNMAKPTFMEMIKEDATNAAYRSAATQMTKGTKMAIVALMENKGQKSESVQAVKELLDSEAGEAVIAVLLGMGLTYAPKISDDPRAQKLATEFRVTGMATGMNAVLGVVMENFLPVISSAMSGLPEVEETPALVEDSPPAASNG